MSVGKIAQQPRGHKPLIALDVLVNVEQDILNILEKEPYQQQLNECILLKLEAKKIQNRYTRVEQYELTSLFLRTLSNVNNTYNRIEQHIERYISYHPADQVELKRAQKYGYTGSDPIEAKKSLNALLQGIAILVQKGYIPEEQVIYRDQYIDCDATFENMRTFLKRSSEKIDELKVRLNTLLKDTLTPNPEKERLYLMTALIALGFPGGDDSCCYDADLYHIEFEVKDFGNHIGFTEIAPQRLLDQANNLSFDLSPSDSEECDVSQRPFARTKSTRDAGKFPENEEIKPNIQVKTHSQQSFDHKGIEVEGVLPFKIHNDHLAKNT